MALIRDFNELNVYKLGFSAAMRVFRLTKGWPMDERFALTSQIRRSSRGVCGNIAEGWRKRRYPAHFIAKLTDADGEVAETQNWLDFAVECEYISSEQRDELRADYRKISGGLVRMMTQPDDWCGPSTLREERAEYNAFPEEEDAS